MQGGRGDESGRKDSRMSIGSRGTRKKGRDGESECRKEEMRIGGREKIWKGGKGKKEGRSERGYERGREGESRKKVCESERGITDYNHQ